MDLDHAEVRTDNATSSVPSIFRNGETTNLVDQMKGFATVCSKGVGLGQCALLWVWQNVRAQCVC